MKLSNIRDIVLILAAVYFVGRDVFKPSLVTNGSSVSVEKKLTERVARLEVKGFKDSIVVKPVVRKYTKVIPVVSKQVVVDSIVAVMDTAEVKVSRDTVKLDGIGTLYGLHVSNDSVLTNKYFVDIDKSSNFANKRERISIWSDAYSNGSVGFSLSGLNYKNKTIALGYQYDLINKTHALRVGVRLFNL